MKELNYGYDQKNSFNGIRHDSHGNVIAKEKAGMRNNVFGPQLKK